MVSPTPGFSVAPITAIDLGEKKGFVCKVLFDDINAYDLLIILRYPIGSSSSSIVTAYAEYIYLCPILDIICNPKLRRSGIDERIFIYANIYYYYVYIENKNNYSVIKGFKKYVSLAHVIISNFTMPSMI